MFDSPLSHGQGLLVVDDRPEGGRGGLRTALGAWTAAVRATSTEGALALARRLRPALAVVYSGLDGESGRKPGGVILAVELARRLPDLSLLLVGAAGDLSGWNLLHEMGGTSRFLPDSASAEDCGRLLHLLVAETAARGDLATALRAVAPTEDRKLESMYLGRFAAGVERRLISTALQQGATHRGAAKLLGLTRDGLRARLRKLGMSLDAPAPAQARSNRDRVLVVGTGPAGLAFARVLAGGDSAALLLGPGELHAGVEAKGGARAAVIEADTVDAAVDAWALRRVAPAIPILLHGRGAAQIRLLLRTLGGLPDVLSTDALSSSFATVAERLFALGRASCAADALCLSAGGAGQGPSAAQAIDLRDVMSATADCLKQSAMAQEPTREKAAELLHISVRDLYRGRKPSQ